MSLPVPCRQQANSPMTVCAPPASTAAASQAFTYHNTDSAEVTSAWPHCAPSDQPSAAQGESHCSAQVFNKDCGESVICWFHIFYSGLVILWSDHSESYFILIKRKATRCSCSWFEHTFAIFFWIQKYLLEVSIFTDVLSRVVLIKRGCLKNLSIVSVYLH